MRRYYTSAILLLSLAFILASCGDSSTGPDNGGGENEPARYDVTTSIDPSGGGSVSPADTTVDDGETVSMQASAASDYVFTHWSGEIDSTSDNPLSLTVDQNYSLTANFELKTYELTINTEGQGSVSEEVLEQKTSEYETGTVVELTAQPEEGYKFVEWKGDVSGTENPTEITIDNSKEVTAVFEKKDYALTVNTNGEGAVSEQIVQQKSTDYEYGTVVELTANPSTGWKFVEWQDAATGTSNPTEVTVDTAKTVTAVFEKKKYAVTVTTTGDGTVSKSPDQTEYVYESTVDLTANPSTGWKFVEWTGDATGTNNPINITVNQEKSVEAVFEKKTYALTVSTQGEGSVTKSPDQTEYKYNTNVDLTANPNSGWEFVEWQGDVTGKNNPEQVTMDSPKDVTAVFKDKDALYVDDTGDAPDATPGDGDCATSGGVCTLRAAIQEANSTSGLITIRFDIAGSGPHTIQPRSALPTVTSGVIVFDGTSEPDYNDSPVIEIDGSYAGSGVVGLTVQHSSVIEGLSIINFDGEGIVLDGTASSTIQNNYIGVAVDGSVAGNGASGINVTNNATDNLITGNVISNNSQRGIFIGLAGSDNNTIAGNLIGTDPSGTSPMGNTFEGVLANGVTGTTIGGTSASSRNIIAANGRGGVSIVGGNASIKGNYIGTNISANSTIPNAGNGIEIGSGATSCTIGGTSPDAGNVVAGNENIDVYIGGNSNTVEGNYLETNPSGDDLGSSYNALRIEGDNNMIGGTSSAASNVIGYSATNMISISGSNNTLYGNYIGEMPDGTEIGNPGASIRIFGSGQTIGGVGSGEGNTIANADFGVGLSSGTGHTIRGNSIYNQSQQGIDFNRDGVTMNDAGDSDDGINRLQNFPEIQSVSYDANADEVTVTYEVPSDPSLTGSGASAYDLNVDFYVTDGNGSGKVYLGTDTYTATDYNNGPTKQITFSPQSSVASGDNIVGTATDANGNTSEFSATPATVN